MAADLKARRFEFIGQVIGYHKADVVPRVGVFRANVAKRKNQEFHLNRRLNGLNGLNGFWLGAQKLTPLEWQSKAGVLQHK
jgi:hypothetical protein